MKNANLILLLLTCILACGCSCHLCKKCRGVALLIPKNEEVALQDGPHGRILSFIVDKPDSDFYNQLTVKKIRDRYAYVEVSNDRTDVPKKGWIALENIGIRPGIYSGDLYLYSKPDIRSKIQSIIRDPYWEYYRIVRCSDGWFYVKYELNNKIFEGWLAPEKQCSNPYSPCN